MVWEAGLGGDQIPTVEDEDQAASEPDDHAEKPMDMETLRESVDFCAPRRWPGSREMSVVEDRLMPDEEVRIWISMRGEGSKFIGILPSEFATQLSMIGK